MIYKKKDNEMNEINPDGIDLLVDKPSTIKDNDEVNTVV